VPVFVDEAEIMITRLISVDTIKTLLPKVKQFNVKKCDVDIRTGFFDQTGGDGRIIGDTHKLFSVINIDTQ